ncbi:unnamed protein product [Rhizoctonia solani]|uniref:Uncharacterized protein n=1 Tax=Rhizoctonia solani TaxID=456999 RepID=A0A8H3E4E9_9AGAM|nr:unnamed protein product [Rhizoctonia solani]
MSSLTRANNSHETTLVPPQLPPFLANVFNLKPIVGNPSCEEVKLVHEAVRALHNFPQTSELKDTDLSIELSQYLFDIQMSKNSTLIQGVERLTNDIPACHRHKYPTSILPNDVVYDPPTLPAYIPVDLNPVIGPPSNKEVASVHTALRISESFANVPSIFDPDLHVQLSQHLFDIQLARHVQRSITHVTSADRSSRAHTSLDSTTGQVIESAEIHHAPVEESSPSNEDNAQQHSNERNDTHRTTELIIKLEAKLDIVCRILVGTQNSLARGFNSSLCHVNYNEKGMSYDLGAHSLINDYGQVPEAHNLPTFKSLGERDSVWLNTNKLSENELARYLRFYNIGEEMIEEEEELKIKSGMVDSAKDTLSRRLFLNR